MRNLLPQYVWSRLIIIIRVIIIITIKVVSLSGRPNRKSYEPWTIYCRWTRHGPFPIYSMERGHFECPRSLGLCRLHFLNGGQQRAMVSPTTAWLSFKTALYCHVLLPKCGLGTFEGPSGVSRGSIAGSQSVVWGASGFLGGPWLVCHKCNSVIA